MIRAVTAAEVSALPCESEALLRIAALAQVYGDTWQALRFWRGEGGSALSLADGVATLHAGEDADDVLLFLHMSPDVHTVRTDADTAVKMAAMWGTDALVGEVMTAPCAIAPLGTATEPPLSALYPLLKAVFDKDIPPFDVWYADVHHRHRHGFFRAAAVMEEGQAVSCALVSAQSNSAVLLGGVATLPEARGRGYASACVTALSHAEQAAGRAVYISPKNEQAAALYRRLGFVPCGTWGIVHKG